jgi:F-type H+-transporting ATPase subunit delta
MDQTLTCLGDALFELAQPEGKDERILNELEELAKAEEDLPELTNALAHPKLTFKQKESLLGVFEDQIDPLLSNFLKVALLHGKAHCLKDILLAYRRKRDAFYHIERVQVQTPSPLSDKELAQLKTLLEDKLGVPVQMEVSLHPELIAGLRVQASGYLLDNTVLNKLKTMKEQLVESR